jgi:hypothetical protein
VRFHAFLGEALCLVAMLARPRSGRREGREALEALEFIDNERVIQLAMLADAGDESLMVARFYDSGHHDPGQAASVHDQFRCRIDTLFLQGRCAELGFTRHALVILQQVHTVVLPNSVKRIGGGVSQDEFDRALGRMKAWVYLATLTIQSEFPRYDVTHCISMFRLDSIDVFGQDGRGREDYIKRFAQVLSLGAVELQAELNLVMPFAASIKASGKGMTSLDAWRTAVTRLSSKSTHKFYGRIESLRAALIRACAWQGSTTSGVEQFFSRVDMLGTEPTSVLGWGLAGAPASSSDVLGRPQMPRPIRH